MLPSNQAAEIKIRQTRQCFSSLLSSNFGCSLLRLAVGLYSHTSDHHPVLFFLLLVMFTSICTFQCMAWYCVVVQLKHIQRKAIKNVPSVLNVEEELAFGCQPHGGSRATQLRLHSQSNRARKLNKEINCNLIL